MASEARKAYQAEWHCNTALGGFRDDPALLAKAIDYLKGARHLG